ncbi:hypothetical protein [Robertmurraya massiliosenegalensis]|uniref:hypothetical protein n=2 Tax=Robertmurraya massiliosenegalensis TaxID=1287657 RepID=UPI00036840E1|nr:hypothetical protein [Robertmurraya massiliosenegalensis]
MKNRQMYMQFHKDYGCWLKVVGDYGKAMYPGESFHLLLGNKLRIPCRLKVAGQRLWYVEIGTEQVRLNLRMNEIYEIQF